MNANRTIESNRIADTDTVLSVHFSTPLPQIDSAKAYTRHWDFIYNANADKKKSSTKEAIDDSEEIECDHTPRNRCILLHTHVSAT